MAHISIWHLTLSFSITEFNECLSSFCVIMSFISLFDSYDDEVKMSCSEDIYASYKLYILTCTPEDQNKMANQKLCITKKIETLI